MSMAISNNPTPTLQLRGLACIANATCNSGTGAAPRPAGDFDKLMRQAIALQGDGRGSQDAAIATYFQALQASSSYDQAVSLAVQLPNRYGYRDVTYAAMGEVIKRAGTRDQALSAAELAFTKGHAFDRWAIGALDKALALSSTPTECREIAALAQQHDHFERFNDISRRALAKAGG